MTTNIHLDALHAVGLGSTNPLLLLAVFSKEAEGKEAKTANGRRGLVEPSIGRHH